MGRSCLPSPGPRPSPGCCLGSQPAWRHARFVCTVWGGGSRRHSNANRTQTGAFFARWRRCIAMHSGPSFLRICFSDFWFVPRARCPLQCFFGWSGSVWPWLVFRSFAWCRGSIALQLHDFLVLCLMLGRGGMRGCRTFQISSTVSPALATPTRPSP